MVSAMSKTNWFRRLLSPSRVDDETEGSADAGYMPGSPGISGFAGLETAGTLEGMEHETEAPPDLAP